MLFESTRRPAPYCSNAHVCLRDAEEAACRHAAGFRRHMPEVQLTLGEMPFRDQLTALEDAVIDFGFLRPPVNTDRIAAQTLVREPLLVALPLGHPLGRSKSIPLACLAGEPFVMFTPGRPPLHTQMTVTMWAASCTTFPVKPLAAKAEMICGQPSTPGLPRPSASSARW
jgi:DNA-binding transcriptional LysR family regulator